MDIERWGRGGSGAVGRQRVGVYGGALDRITAAIIHSALELHTRLAAVRDGIGGS